MPDDAVGVTELSSLLADLAQGRSVQGRLRPATELLSEASFNALKSVATGRAVGTEVDVGAGVADAAVADGAATAIDVAALAAELELFRSASPPLPEAFVRQLGGGHLLGGGSGGTVYRLDHLMHAAAAQALCVSAASAMEEAWDPRAIEPDGLRVQRRRGTTGSSEDLQRAVRSDLGTYAGLGAATLTVAENPSAPPRDVVEKSERMVRLVQQRLQAYVDAPAYSDARDAGSTKPTADSWRGALQAVVGVATQMVEAVHPVKGLSADARAAVEALAKLPEDALPKQVVVQVRKGSALPAHADPLPRGTLVRVAIRAPGDADGGGGGEDGAFVAVDLVCGARDAVLDMAEGALWRRLQRLHGDQPISEAETRAFKEQCRVFLRVLHPHPASGGSGGGDDGDGGDDDSSLHLQASTSIVARSEHIAPLVGLPVQAVSSTLGPSDRHLQAACTALRPPGPYRQAPSHVTARGRPRYDQEATDQLVARSAALLRFLATRARSTRRCRRASSGTTLRVP